jgi:hypothetical protein
MPDVERAEAADLETCIDHLAGHDEPLVRRLALLAHELQGELNLRDQEPVELRLRSALAEIARLRAAQADYVSTHRHIEPVSARTLMEEATEHEDEADFGTHPLIVEAFPAEVHS